MFEVVVELKVLRGVFKLTLGLLEALIWVKTVGVGKRGVIEMVSIVD